MTCLVITLAVAGFGFGIAGATYWWRSSVAIPIETLAVAYSGPGQTGAAAASALLADLRTVARLNRWAAIWTGVAIIFTTAATLAGALSPN